jgi:hypothetical protein
VSAWAPWIGRDVVAAEENEKVAAPGSMPRGAGSGDASSGLVGVRASKTDVRRFDGDGAPREV